MRSCLPFPAPDADGRPLGRRSSRRTAAGVTAALVVGVSALGAAVVTTGSASVAAPSADHLLVSRVSITSAATDVSLVRVTGAGAADGATVALPTAASGINHPFTLEGDSAAVGALARSADGRYVTLAGYTATPGSSFAAVPRVVARVDAAGTVSKSGELRPDRSVLFTATVTGSVATTQLAFGGTNKGLRADLIAWDKANGNRFGFADGAAEGNIPKQIDGFNAEGPEFAPGSTTTAYLGFRAPLVPPAGGGKALLVPVTNIDRVVTGAHATFGTPITMDLGGLSIRDIRKNAADQYLIVAGTWSAEDNSEPYALYSWDGVPAHAPALPAHRGRRCLGSGRLRPRPVSSGRPGSAGH